MTTLLATLALAAGVLGGLPAEDGWRARSSAKPAAATKTTKLTLKHSSYGRVLFADGYAIYLFTRDQSATSRCYGACAKAWPPLKLHDGKIDAGKGVKEGLLGTTTREGGGTQVTYGGHPLYGYVHDPRGEVFCHDVVEFGGTWYGVRKSGNAAP